MLKEILNNLFGRTPRVPSEPPVPTFERLEDRLLLSLIGVDLEFPQVPYDATGVVTYDAATDSFDSDATPLAFRLGPTDAGPIMPPRDFQLHIKVDENGNRSGGIAGDDLVIEGQIDIDHDGTIDYDGVLLTGEILDFGFLDSGGPTDQYDFRFYVTGGDLAPLFAGMDIGLKMVSTNSTFTGDFSVNFGGKAQGVVGAIEPIGGPQTSTLAGRIFHDANNNGVDDGETGIAGATVALTSDDGSVNMSTTTGVDGSYAFVDLLPGEYTITETQPDGFLDGGDAVGNVGGTLGNDVLSGIVLAGGEEGTGYIFGEIRPASVSGFVWEDFNNDGLIDFNEYAIEGVTVTLTGTDDLGQAVELTDVTDVDGIYAFVDLRPGTYTITETQPAGYEDGVDVIGEVAGQPVGTAGNDVFTGVTLNQNQDGVNYNFGERPLAGSTVTAGQTATIGFWQNKNGQELLKSVDGSIGAWLAATFPNMYGISAGENDLSSMTNAEVAAYYKAKFQAKVKGSKNGSLEGPAKFDCQVLTTAFAVYVTNGNLAGAVGENYGFIVDMNGVGIATWNVGLSGAAFGVDDYTDMTVMDLLLATNDMSENGVLYLNFDVMYRELANKVYSAINESGDI